MVGLLFCRFVQDGKGIVEVAGRSSGCKVCTFGLRSERDGEVVAEGVDYDDNCLVECLGMPAPLLRVTR